MLLFDKQGLLTPAKSIPVSVDELYDELVGPFPDSETRERLFQNWMTYNRMLRQEIGVDFAQWVDGSFVTQKLNPNDLDVVSFIPSHLFRKFEKRLDYYWTDNWEREGIDAYLVEVFPDYHQDYTITASRIEEWNDRYTKAKPIGTKQQIRKGYLTVNIS